MRSSTLDFRFARFCICCCSVLSWIMYCSYCFRYTPSIESISWALATKDEKGARMRKTAGRTRRERHMTNPLITFLTSIV